VLEKIPPELSHNYGCFPQDTGFAAVACSEVVLPQKLSQKKSGREMVRMVEKARNSLSAMSFYRDGR
jgi:hypothetical protein